MVWMLYKIFFYVLMLPIILSNSKWTILLNLSIFLTQRSFSETVTFLLLFTVNLLIHCLSFIILVSILATNVFRWLLPISRIYSTSIAVTTYSSQRPELSPLLPLPPIVSYRQPPKLRNLLVHSKLPSVDDTNFVGPCIVRLCLCCHVMNSDTTIFTPSGTLYAIKGHFKCSFRDLVYMIGYMTGTSAKQVVCWSEESANTEEHRTTAPSFASWSKN